MTTSIWLKKVSVGTEIKIIQEGIPSSYSSRDVLFGLARVIRKIGKTC